MIGRWFFMFLGLFGALAPALVYWYGAHAVINGELDGRHCRGDGGAAHAAVRAGDSLFSTHVTVQTNMALFERIFDYLDLKPEIEEQPDAVEVPRAIGRLEFDHVSFRYTPHRLALNDVSFDVEPGQIAALVGPSGAGKTTISYLIPRLFDVTEGAVRLDGIDVRDLTLDQPRREHRHGHAGAVHLPRLAARQHRSTLGPMPADDDILRGDGRGEPVRQSSPGCRRASTPSSASAATG